MNDEDDIYRVCHAEGGMSAHYWRLDPRRVAFVSARYLATAKFLAGKARVLEVGCADGFGSRIVRQHVGAMVAVDTDARSIEEARAQDVPDWHIEFRHLSAGALLPVGFDAVFALDVIEHIEQPALWLQQLSSSAPCAVLGTPSEESQRYAGALSRAGHVNCYTEPRLREELLRFWRHVFLFGMNDTTLHQGFGPMCHYRFALCVN